MKELIDTSVDHTEPLATDEECKSWTDAHPGEEMPEWIHKWYREVVIPREEELMRQWQQYMETIREN